VGLSALERKVTGQVEEPPGKRGCLGLGFLHAMYTYVYIYIFVNDHYYFVIIIVIIYLFIYLFVIYNIYI